MDDSILNVEQAVEFLGISEKTLIKMLREEHIPARKIGREWRFSKKALTDWLAAGDSINYINRSDYYRVSQDEKGKRDDLLDSLTAKIGLLKNVNNIKRLLKIEKDIDIPENATLRVSYKQQREIEKIEFKIFWPIRDGFRGLSRSGESTAGGE